MNDNSKLIDRYLQNEMSADEKTAFENQLAADKSLQEEFAIQQKIIKAATAAGLKLEFAKAIRNRIRGRQLIRWGIIIVILSTAFIFYSIKTGMFTHPKTSTELDRGKGIEQFEINNATDTIIETRDGVVFAIPAHAFNSSGKYIQLEIKTALNAHDIIENGLSTMSNDALLQTAGMFYINGYENGKEVPLEKEIAVSVPANQVNPAMQLFDGVGDTDGHINWVHPKPVDKRLRVYDISSLDFYPPRYIPTLKALAKTYEDKKYTDSLYYSFTGYPFRIMKKDSTARIHSDTISERDYATRDTSKILLTDSLSDQPGYGSEGSYEINPARIKAIWNKKFNNTIIATKEFEERLRYMHSLCTSIYLDIYLGNLNKPLFEIDKLCADRSSGEIRKKFLEFAARKDGGVMITDGLQQELSHYFEQKCKAYNEAAAKTWASYETELIKLNTIADAKSREEAVNNFERTNNNFREEFCINLSSAYSQIGVKHSCNDTIIPPSGNYYNVTINSTGWKNLDVYVYDATTSRESMTYTDSITGKTSLISYADITIDIENPSQFDRVLVYLIPDSLSSFQRVKQEGNSFKEALNMTLRYDAVVLAYKSSQVFFHREQNLKPANYVFSLSSITNDALDRTLSAYSFSKTTALRNEFEYQFFEQQEAIRQLVVQKDQQFRQQVAASIFNCGDLKSK